MGAGGGGEEEGEAGEAGEEGEHGEGAAGQRVDLEGFQGDEEEAALPDACFHVKSRTLFGSERSGVGPVPRV